MNNSNIKISSYKKIRNEFTHSIIGNYLIYGLAAIIALLPIYLISYAVKNNFIVKENFTVVIIISEAIAYLIFHYTRKSNIKSTKSAVKKLSEIRINNPELFNLLKENAKNNSNTSIIVAIISTCVSISVATLTFMSTSMINVREMNTTQKTIDDFMTILKYTFLATICLTAYISYQKSNNYILNRLLDNVIINKNMINIDSTKN